MARDRLRFALAQPVGTVTDYPCHLCKAPMVVRVSNKTGTMLQCEKPGCYTNTDSRDEIRRMAVSDDPLAARALLPCFPDGPDKDALVQSLDAHLEHLDSRDRFRAFYEEQCPERPFLPEHLIPRLHDVMPRCAWLRMGLQAQGARSILEIGCFDGFLLLHLATIGMHGVGVDVAQYAIDEANRRALALKAPCRFQQGFAEDLALAERFDAVVLCEILEHVVDVPPVLAVAEQHLAPGGRVYVSMPLDVAQHTDWRSRKEHVRHFTPEDVWKLLSAEGRRPLWYQQYQTPDGWAQMGSYGLG